MNKEEYYDEVQQHPDISIPRTLMEIAIQLKRIADKLEDE